MKKSIQPVGLAVSTEDVDQGMFAALQSTRVLTVWR